MTITYEDELFIDNFAGGGGASTGIELAIGRSVDVAINHDPAAIAMHEANHPNTKHYCESVWDVDPREVTGGKPVALAWFSPDCTHHSKARGGKPREKGIRGLAWVAVRWAATVAPRVIMLENVEEFEDWGPLDKEGRPIKAKKGWTFKLFVKTLRKLGYEVEWRVLRGCDYGVPTTRKRLFLIARCDGKAIVWPAPTHVQVDKPFPIKAGGPLPYRRAADIIDWSIPVPSIFGRKRELADNTKRRIARGIDKFIIKVAEAGGVPFMAPYLVNVSHGGDGFRGQGLNEPLQTVTGKNGIGLVVPHITRIGHTGFGGDRLQYEVDEPLTTITSKNEHMLACANLIQYHSETVKGEVRGQALDQPIMTLDTSNRYGLVVAHVARHFGESIGNSMGEPLATVTAGGGGKSALVSSHLIKFRGDNVGSRMDEPVPTITAGGLHIGAVYAFMVAYYGSSVGQEMAAPLGTVTTHDRFGLVLVRVRGVDYVIVDIGMRMLTPRELYRAQGFPDSYIINPMFNGKPFTQAEQVAKCGNSVCPPIPAALVRANLPEHCVVEWGDRYSKAEWAAMLA